MSKLAYVYRLYCWLYVEGQMVFLFYCSFSLFLPHHTVSLFPSLYSQQSFYSKPHSHSSFFTLLLEAISDLFEAELCKCLSKRKMIHQVRHNDARIKLILTHYPCVILSPKCSSQFFQTHIICSFLPVLQIGG